MDLVIYLTITFFSVAAGAIIAFLVTEANRYKPEKSLKYLKSQIIQSEYLLSEKQLALEELIGQYAQRHQLLDEQLAAVTIATKEKRDAVKQKYDELIEKDRIIKAMLQKLADALSVAENKIL